LVRQIWLLPMERKKTAVASNGDSKKLGFF
jgi:hypothetical protein